MSKKINIKELTISEALSLDVKSNDFWEVYKVISERYWNFEEPDDHRIAAKTLVMYAERYDADKVILSHKIIEQVINLSKDEKPNKSVTGHLAFKNKDFFFDIYENERSKDRLQEVLAKSAKAMRDGNIVVKNQFGKNFY